MSDACPTLVITNAMIATGDPRHPWATALAMRGDTLVAIAAAAEILKTAGPSTSVRDAGGQTLRLPLDAAVGAPLFVAERVDAHIELRGSQGFNCIGQDEQDRQDEQLS